MATIQNAVYACTALLGTNKVGDLKPDANGYYEVVLGALDVYNSGGAYYSYNGGKAIFDESSTLMRRIANGALRGEYGHPKRLPGQTLQEYMLRCCNIHEDMVSHHISKVWLDHQRVKGKDGRPIIAIMGLVKPCGPYGKFLEEQLKNASENVCFSIRSFTNDVVVAGVTHKNLKVVFTWDYVNEPGIEYANKYKAPSLECYMDSQVVVTQDIISSMQRECAGQGNESVAFALESLLAMFSEETVESIDYQLPPSARW